MVAVIQGENLDIMTECSFPTLDKLPQSQDSA